MCCYYLPLASCSGVQLSTSVLYSMFILTTTATMQTARRVFIRFYAQITRVLSISHAFRFEKVDKQILYRCFDVNFCSPSSYMKSLKKKKKKTNLKKDLIIAGFNECIDSSQRYSVNWNMFQEHLLHLFHQFKVNLLHKSTSQRSTMVKRNFYSTNDFYCSSSFLLCSFEFKWNFI